MIVSFLFRIFKFLAYYGKAGMLFPTLQSKEQQFFNQIIAVIP